MKKLVAISILLTLLTAAAFAQFKVGLEAAFTPDLLYITTPTGDAAKPNTTGPNNPASGDTYAGLYGGTGTFDFLTISDRWVGHDLNIKLSYTDPKAEAFGGSLQLKGGDWVVGLATSNGTTLDDFLNQTLGDWDVWGKVGIFKAYAGNGGYRGATGDYRYEGNFSDFFDKAKIDNFGIINASGDALDINNVGKGVWLGTQFGTAAMYVQADLAPVKVTLAGDFGETYPYFHKAPFLPQGAIPDQATASYSAAGGALQVSANPIEMLNLDVIYKLSGADSNTDDKLYDLPASTNSQPGGEGIWNHAFGIYANVNLDTIVSGLGVSVGYSGYTAARENQKGGLAGGAATDATRYVFPYLNGIDLRVKFGAGPLALTFNNNFSFSAVTNDDDELTYYYGYDYANGLFVDQNTNGAGRAKKDYTASYFAMYNALGVTYTVSDQLSANVSIGNTLRTYNETDEHITASKVVTDTVTDTFTAVAGVKYAFTDNVSLQSGLAFKVEGNSAQITNSTSQDWGTFTFGIPIRFKVSW